jgi:UDP-N-acetyl-D-glucosamine dehydrogenase
MKISVIGLGYVGLPLSLQFATSNVEVLGLDIDENKVEHLNHGRSYIRHITSDRIATQVNRGKFEASTDFSRVKEVEAIIICVPTPLTKNLNPDLSFILKTASQISAHFKPGTLIVLESTTYPGTTEEELKTALESGSGLRAGTDFHLAYSPEREDPGNAKSRVAEIPKIIGGLTPACLEKAKNLYSLAVQNLVPVSSCRVAEATKLLENIFRSVNIALVNELKMVYGAMGINIWEVIAAAKTKPFGFMPFYPGPGLGGHCIPIDPFYLAWKAREYGQNSRFIELAGEINTSMPQYVILQLMEALNHYSKPLKGSRILILGLAYKPDVDDDRESPSYVLMDAITAKAGVVDYYDPNIPMIRSSREHSHWAGKQSITWEQKTISDFDAVIISTAHTTVRYDQLLIWSKIIVDTRNCVPLIPEKVWQA